MVCDSVSRSRRSASAPRDLLAALQAGELGFEALADESGLEYGFHEAVKRNSAVPDATLVQEVFRLQVPEEGEAVHAVLPAGSGFAVVELNKVEQGVLEGGAIAGMQQYERAIANGNASQETTAVMSQLRSIANIEVYEDRIK